MLFYLVGNQVVFGNSHLFLYQVARYLYHLHTISQWRRNGAYVIGRGDKEDVREVILHFKVVIGKSGILRRVEHL